MITMHCFTTTSSMAYTRLEEREKWLNKFILNFKHRFN